MQAAAKVGTVAMAAIGTATVAAGTAFADNIKQTAEYADNIDKMSQKIGISAQAYQEWDFIMQHSGASVDSLQMGVKTLSQKMEKAAEVIQNTVQADLELEQQLENGTITLEEYNQKYDDLYESAYKDIDAFTKLGYSMHELESFESTEELLSDVITRLQGMEEGAERTALASELLGRSGVELGALFNTSAEDVEAMRQQVHDLGGVMSDEAVKAGAAYQDSLQNLGVSVSSLERNLSSQFLPSVTSMMDGLSSLITGDESGFALIETGINDFISNLANELPKFFELGAKIVENLATAILDNLPKLFESGVSIITKLLMGAVELLPKIIELGLDLIVSLALGIANALPELIPTILEVIFQIVDILTNPDSLSQIIGAALTLLLALTEGLLSERSINALVDAVFALIDALITFLLDPDNILMLVNAAVEIVTAIALGLIKGAFKIVDSTVKLITNIVDIFKKTDWGKLGKDIIDGVWDGLKKSWTNLTSWFTDAWDGLVGGVKNLLGIHSPSRVFAGIGENMALGLGEGWDDEFSKIKKDIDGSMSFDGTISPSKAYKYSQIGSKNIFESLTININGANYSDENALVEAIAEKIQELTEGKERAYAL